MPKLEVVEAFIISSSDDELDFELSSASSSENKDAEALIVAVLFDFLLVGFVGFVGFVVASIKDRFCEATKTAKY